jgi:hypothetical protein
MVLIGEILSANHCAIFVRCLDSQLRFVPQVISGVSLRSDRYIRFWERSLDGQCAASTRGTAPEERVKCVNQLPASMKENIRRGYVSG